MAHRNKSSWRGCDVPGGVLLISNESRYLDDVVVGTSYVSQKEKEKQKHSYVSRYVRAYSVLYDFDLFR